jgi:DNA repair exonuclease SbcCD ATPase subunit
MIPLSLKLKNFMCYESANLDFSKFESALIVGKINNNLDISNGAGKSSIFNAIEYALFNDFGDIKLDKIVRDGQQSCSVEFEFNLSGLNYKIVRGRTAKGTATVQLFEFCNSDWKDLSGRRNSDVEEQIKKLIKINSKSFRNSTHFVQHDFSGITNSKTQERKNILKQIFDLSIYTKLEKLAKEKLSTLQKESIKLNAVLEANQDPESSLEKLQLSLANVQINLQEPTKSLSEINEKIEQISIEKNSILEKIKLDSANLPVLESKLKELNLKLLNLQESLKSDNLKLNSLIQNKIKNEEKLTLIKEPTDKYEQDLKSLKLEIENDLKLLRNCDVNCQTIHNQIITLENALDISECQTCLQTVPTAHSEKIQKEYDSLVKLKSEETEKLNKISEKIKDKKINEKKLESLINSQNADIKNIYIINNDLSLINNNIINIKDSIKYKEDNILNINKEIEELILEKSKISLDNININKNKYNSLDVNLKNCKNTKNDLLFQIDSFNKELSKLETLIDQKKELINTNKEIRNKLSLLEEELNIYPLIVEAFSTTGIPSFIINNLLNEVQEKANLFCTKIKPGLQIQFILNKENSSGEEVDTLDIKYYYNGQEREYSQLSGAMKFNATFSIKLALSIIIQEVLETEIKFFLFDEIDSSLDKFSSNEFVNVVKELQNDYKILLITHGDSLKDKFTNKIIVEQNQSGFSTIIQN